MISKSVVITSDLHAGADNALTTEPQNVVQEKLLDLYDSTIKSLGYGPELLIVNGDLIDGPQRKGGSLSESNLVQQDRIAAELIARWNPKEVMVVSGTKYHVADDGVNHEENVVTILNAMGIQSTFHRRLRLTLQDWFDLECRHYIGTSSNPSGRANSPNRVKVWRNLTSQFEGRKAPNLLVFGHAHYYQFTEDSLGATLILPCWQAYGGVYGDEICDGQIDLGAVRLDLNPLEKTWNICKKVYSAHLNTPRLSR